MIELTFIFNINIKFDKSGHFGDSDFAFDFEFFGLPRDVVGVAGVSDLVCSCWPGGLLVCDDRTRPVRKCGGRCL